MKKFLLAFVVLGLLAGSAFAATKNATASWDVTFEIKVGGTTVATVAMPKTSIKASEDFVSFDLISMDGTVADFETHMSAAAKKKTFVTASEVTIDSATKKVEFAISYPDKYAESSLGASFDVEHIFVNLPTLSSTALISNDAETSVKYKGNALNLAKVSSDVFVIDPDDSSKKGIQLAAKSVTLESVPMDANIYLFIKPGADKDGKTGEMARIVVKVPLKYKFTSGGDDSISLINPNVQLQDGLVKLMTEDGERPNKYTIMKAFNLDTTDDIEKVMELTDQFQDTWTPTQMEEFCKMFYSDVKAALAEEGQRVAVVFPAITIDDTSLVYAFEAKLVGLAKGQSLELHAYKAGVPNELMNSALDDVIADAVFVNGSTAAQIESTTAADQKVAIGAKVPAEGDYIFYLTTSDEEEPTTEPTTTPSGTPTTEPTTEPSGTPTTTPSGTPTTTPTTTPHGGSSSSSGGCDMGLVSGLAILLAALLPLRKVRK
ncbi:MAG: hypothetical protein IJU98_03040 [Synergistaceae bacterium]|nr:hypothetical protein [Synergistaceae bacterium]